MNNLSDLGHALVAWLGILIASSAAITEYVVDLGAPRRIVGAVFVGLGLLATLASKYTDSQHNAKVVTAQLAAAVAPAQRPPLP